MTARSTAWIQSPQHGGTTTSRPRPPIDWSARFSPSSSRPKPYAAHLAPRPSPLRPHCHARERLLLWKPLPSEANTNFSPTSRRLVFNVLSRSLAPGTLETYGSGLLLFHVICDTHSIAEHARAPAGKNVIALFIAELVGRYSESAIRNAVAAVRAWHVLHRHLWSPNDAEVDALIRAAGKEAPRRKPIRNAFDMDTLSLLVAKLSPSVPLDAAVTAALLVGFWGTARLGELLPKTLQGAHGFDASRCVTVSNLRHSCDDQGNPISVLHLPCTKVEPVVGEDIYWAPRADFSDATSALQRHFSLNAPTPSSHLFAYIDKHRKLKTLTKTAFLARLTAAAAAAGLPAPQGHSIRISSTTHYLLHGLSFDAMRVKGRWASNAFTLYLRRHAEIMAPYLQERPGVHLDILSRTAVLPPTARR
ncbi:hypothetical protein AURDEDRAFT_76054 [Auricularia subglabra TFB-10046 SS5]|uniref:DNA breaking-rejoining enzyme n=1 Tax=Auricularia subglabra (strain TFB-10046 / SS5) TaxID=717982 RepID=J0D6U5_AURST|nr:hypothetical protein AURDEDRAFT_76054 [Auricularia subglabra TFB-10046 SS5]